MADMADMAHALISSTQHGPIRFVPNESIRDICRLQFRSVSLQKPGSKTATSVRPELSETWRFGSAKRHHCTAQKKCGSVAQVASHILHIQHQIS